MPRLQHQSRAFLLSNLSRISCALVACFRMYFLSCPQPRDFPWKCPMGPQQNGSGWWFSLLGHEFFIFSLSLSLSFSIILDHCLSFSIILYHSRSFSIIFYHSLTVLSFSISPYHIYHSLSFSLILYLSLSLSLLLFSLSLPVAFKKVRLNPEIMMQTKLHRPLAVLSPS